MDTRLSVIIPIFNARRYLKPCIDSILCQTVSDFELVLVDDGSTDDSSILCDEYKMRDSRIKVVHQQNKGVSAARNAGIDNATGKYIVFVDSDDSVEPTFLETIQKEMSDFDILFWGNTYHYADGLTLIHSPNATIAADRDSCEQEILKLKANSEGFEYFGYTWSKAFRRDLIEKASIRFTEGLSYREDELFTADYCRNISSLKVISNPLYHYRVLDTGLTAKPKNQEALYVYADALCKQLEYWQNRELYQFEVSRYAKTLLRIFYNEKGFLRKWNVAKRINNIYRENRMNRLIPQSRIFSSPKIIFPIAVALFCFKKVRT